MADGREHIENIHITLVDLANQLEEQKGRFSDTEFAELTKNLLASQNSVRMCRGKVWLRSKEGTEITQKCLESVQNLRGELGQPSAAIGTAKNLAEQLEALARLIASKSQVLT